MREQAPPRAPRAARVPWSPAGPATQAQPLRETGAAPYLDLLSGVGEGQRVDAAGGPAGLEHVRAVSEDGLAFLSRSGVLSCF